MPKFAGLAICATWAAAGGKPDREIARIALASCRAQLTVENPDQNRLDIGIRRNWDGLSEMTPRKVVRLSFTDGNFEEWRLNVAPAASLVQGGIKQFSCLPPIYMLAECGEYYTTGAGGIRDYSYSQIGVTATQGLTTLVLGTPGIPGFVSVGTVDAAIDAVPIDIESTDEGKTPLAIAFQIRDLVRAKGVPCEVEYLRVGSSGYTIGFRTQVGAGAAVPEFAAGKNVLEYLLAYNSTQQATRVRPRGPVDATGLASRLSRARFKVTAVNGGTKRVTLADEAGGAGPIQYDEQLVGWYAFRELTGRTFQILHSYKATQEIELADVSTMAAHSVTAPEWISFRESETLTGTRRWVANATYRTGVLEVTAVGAGTLTCTPNWDAVDAFNVDNRWVDWSFRRASFVMNTSGNSAVNAGRLDCLSVTGVQAGDLVIAGNVAAPSYTITAPVMVVTSIDTVNKYLFVSSRDGAAMPALGGTRYYRVYRPVATQHLVKTSVAATNVVTVDAVGTAAINDLVEIIQPCQGVLPTYLDSPADVTAYGVKIARLEVTDSGECNPVPNPIMRVWPGSPSAPADGWTWSGTGAATIARNNNAAFTLQGGYSAYCVLAAGGTMGVLTSPPAPAHPILGAALESLRLRLFITDFAKGSEWDPTFTYTYQVRSTISVTLYKRDAGGTLTQLGTPAVFGCPGFANPTALNTWVEAVIPGVDISAIVDEQLVVTVSAAWGGSIPGSSIKAYVDGVQLTQTPAAPRQYPELLIEYAEGTKIWQRTGVELLNWASPPKEVTAKVADLARVDPARYGDDAITLGGNLRLVHAEQGVDQTARCLSLNINHLDDADTDVTIAALQTRFTTLVTMNAA